MHFFAFRKAGHLASDGVAQKTTGWEIEIEERKYKIVFSRDNLHVWIDGYAVDTVAYISDAGYDVDLFFDLDGYKGHICSDVENDRDIMNNYLLINGDCVAKCCQNAHQATK
ncbi:hypothetical protein FSP39_010586 [Pinctada imbricata]|uniref:Uncharacterized protein n=1 Tax=Pinctada imbricata TaxID=66713 RepID=A0AA88XYV8_PINIB|nr:hypothetical protein FSP39_010586 [Pinctada imbricata]